MGPRIAKQRLPDQNPCHRVPTPYLAEVGPGDKDGAVPAGPGGQHLTGFHRCQLADPIHLGQARPFSSSLRLLSSGLFSSRSAKCLCRRSPSRRSRRRSHGPPGGGRQCHSPPESSRQSHSPPGHSRLASFHRRHVTTIHRDLRKWPGRPTASLPGRQWWRPSAGSSRRRFRRRASYGQPEWSRRPMHSRCQRFGCDLAASNGSVAFQPEPRRQRPTIGFCRRDRLMRGKSGRPYRSKRSAPLAQEHRRPEDLPPGLQSRRSSAKSCGPGWWRRPASGIRWGCPGCYSPHWARVASQGRSNECTGGGVPAPDRPVVASGGQHDAPVRAGPAS